MNLTETLITAGVPSGVIALFGFLARNTFADIKTAVGELQKDLRTVLAQLSDQAKAHAVLEATVAHLKSTVDDQDKAIHKLQSLVTALQIKLGIRAAGENQD